MWVRGHSTIMNHDENDCCEYKGLLEYLRTCNILQKVLTWLNLSVDPYKSHLTPQTSFNGLRTFERITLAQLHQLNLLTSSKWLVNKLLQLLPQESVLSCGATHIWFQTFCLGMISKEVFSHIPKQQVGQISNTRIMSRLQRSHALESEIEAWSSPRHRASPVLLPGTSASQPWDFSTKLC